MSFVGNLLDETIQKEMSEEVNDLEGVDYKQSLKKATKEALSGKLPIDKQVEVCTCM